MGRDGLADTRKWDEAVGKHAEMGKNLVVPLNGLAGASLLLSHGARMWLNVIQFSVQKQQNGVRNEN
jgi:hypothetical protein